MLEDSTDTPLATVVIGNHNYGRFLAEAIESALAQTYPAVEVIVVDDGSTDNSREVISCYEGRVTMLMKDQGGQASALNVGFAASSGSGVCFLDADDVLDPAALAAAMPRLMDGGVSNVRWPLEEIDAAGVSLGRRRPGGPLQEGDLAHVVIAGGPDTYVISPTSGNLWSRRFLDAVMPMPEDPFRLCADAYLFGLAPLYGKLAAVSEPLGSYRVHGSNGYSALDVEDKLARDLHNWEARCEPLAARCRALGFHVDTDEWRARSWFHRLERSLAEVCSLVPTGAKLVLIDDYQWGITRELRGRRVVAFPEGGGHPADGESAAAELERLQRAGAEYAVAAWPAFWWFEHYHELTAQLRSKPCLAENDRIVVFDLAG